MRSRVNSYCEDGDMKFFDNDIASFHCDEVILPSLQKFYVLAKEYPFLLMPFRGMNERVRDILFTAGFQLYPTVKRTTLFYEQATDCFFKILHPLSLKHKILFLLADKAKAIYELSEYLLASGLKVSKIVAYGHLKKGRRPFFVMKRITGKSIYNLVNYEHKNIPETIYLEVIDEVAKFHLLGYWLRDVHLGHIFIHGTGVSGFLEVDSIKRNMPFRFWNLVKDVSWLTNPRLLLTEDEKMRFLDYYMNKLNIKKREKFLQYLNKYSTKRWKTQRREMSENKK